MQQTSFPRPRTDHVRPMLPRAAGRFLLVVSIVLTVGSIATVMILLPEGTPISSDPGAPSVPMWAVLLPPAAGILLTLMLPWRPAPMPAEPVRRTRLLVTTGALVVFFAAFTLTASLALLRDEDYIAGKFVLLMVLPAAVVLLVRHSVRFKTRPGPWRWWAPLVVAAVWFYLSQLAPWNPGSHFGAVDPAHLIVAAIATAITAGIGEELFFRRWLQTRLEAMLGAWAGIGVTSVLFGLMHLGSHGTGEPLLDVARVVAIQGSFGWFVGVMWWRYRNLVLIILVHLLSNGWGVIAHFIAAD
ncbi:MAG TPA: type II CAAX endopeptidase family protein [Beutenbergiaceae bacterium]|nr:type II CAAX endopeptidase family protein [Beutenbergiaceae bacterium]